MRPDGRSVHPVSLVHWGAPWGSSRVYLRSLGSLRCALGFIWLIQVHWGSSRGSSGISAVAGFTRVRRGVRRVHQRYLGSLGCTLLVVGFIRERCVHRGRRVHWGAPLASPCSSRVTGFTVVHAGVRRVHLGSLASALGVVGFSGFTGVRTGGRLVHQGSLSSLACALEVVWFILGRLVLWRAPRVSSGSSRVLGCALCVVWSLCSLWSAKGVHPGSLGLLGCSLGVVGFIRGSCVHCGALRGSSSSSPVAGFTAVRHGGRRDHPCRWVHWCSPRWSSGSSSFGGHRAHPEWLGSITCALGLVGFIRCHSVHWVTPLGSLVCFLWFVGIIHGSWNIWGVVGFIRGR